MTTVQRSTSETRIHASISDDFSLTSIDTSIPFLDHMLHTLARYSGLGVVAREHIAFRRPCKP